MKKVIHALAALVFVLICYFVFVSPANALTTYFKDDFPSGTIGQSLLDINSTDYTSSNGYFYDHSSFIYDGIKGLWSNGSPAVANALKSTSINQSYYCAGMTLQRDPTDNRTYPAITINTTNQNNGYIFNTDLNWDTGLIQESSIFSPPFGYLYFNTNTHFNNSIPQHWAQICNNNGTIKIYLDGSLLTTVNNTLFSGGNVNFSLFYAPHSHITNWAITDSPTSNYPGLISPTINLDVPLLKQTDPLWGSQTYDSANKWAPLHSTIEEWGCAETSAAMILKYYKIDKLPDGTALDPGTLNSWLKSQPDGYVGNGLVNWLAISRLTKQAKSQNPTFSYDALEYKRHSGFDASLLTADLQANQPDILEEPGHFIVGKGQSNNVFTINDPYFDRQDLNNTAYNNSFLSLGRYIPSHTDLSYLMLTISPDFDITVTNSSGQKVGGDVNNPFTDIADSSYYLQQGITGPTTNFTPDGLKILTIRTPANGNYTLTITTNNPSAQKFSLQVFAYDTDGNVQSQTLNGVSKQNSPASFSIPYQNTSPSTRGHLTCDPSELKGDNSTLHKLYCDVVHFFNQQ